MDDEKRIYVGDCGCIRVESKHFRATMKPEEFVEMLREIVRKKRKSPSFYGSFTSLNNISSNGFISIQKEIVRGKYE